MIDFENMIANHLEKPAYPKKIGRYYPSSIGFCMRKYWYSYKYPQEINPKTRKIFHMGNVIHDFVVEVLKSEKNPHIKLVSSELPIMIKEKDFEISGRVDDIIIMEENGKVILIEVKSVQDIKYQQKPSPAHIVQLQLYMHASNIHNGAILYIDRKGLDNKIFSVKYDKEALEKAMLRFSKLHDCLTNDTIPPPEAKKDEDWQCKFCEYAEKCEKEQA